MRPYYWRQEKGYEVLYLTEYGDEFVLQTLMEYDGKKFANVSASETSLESKEEKEKLEKINKKNSKMFDLMKEAIDVKEVRFTGSLTDHPVCLSSEGMLTSSMEKVMNAMPNNENVKATMILEINEKHPIAKKIQKLYKEDKEELKNYSKILYAQARLIEGMPIDNPTELSNLICDELS